MNESPSAHDDPPMADEVESEDMGENFGVPWITYVVIAVCGVIFAYFNLAAEAPAFETVTGTLAPSALEIWAGSYWGLITTAFVHIGFWHIAFNMWWAKDFGAVLEPAMGRGRYLIFILLAALVSSGAQLAFSGETGIGFSGVVYAMFGYGLAARNMEPRYQRIVDKSTIQWLLGWLVLCFVLTAIEVWNVGNYAHLVGFLFGYFVGIAFTVRTFIIPSLIGLVTLTILSGLSMFYMPWSDTWQMRGAITEMFAVAEQAQSGNPEAQYKYARIHLVTEDKPEGISWLRKSSAQGYVPAMNSLAWILATDPDGRFRNGEEAVRWARQACEEDGWETAAYIDTLAAAYAEHEQWEDAIVTQRRAMEQVSEVEGNAASYDSRLQKYLERKKVRD